MEVVDTQNPHVFGYTRHHDAGRVLVLANFSERTQPVSANQVRLYGLAYAFKDLVTGEQLTLDADLSLEPYTFLWLVPA
jgi:amylosucrase